MKLSLMLLFMLWCSPSLGQKAQQIPGQSYLIFSPDKVSIKEAKIRQPPINTDLSKIRDVFVKIEFLENSQKNFLLKRSDKKYYKFLLDPFAVKLQPIKAGNIKPLMAPLDDEK
ncbi:MAG: hypothetical protein HRU09_06175 [Oligoflexales bacterium]|nr:hypothetical protein [Oligoflexales bacterium]